MIWMYLKWFSKYSNKNDSDCFKDFGGILDGDYIADTPADWKVLTTIARIGW